MNQGRFSPAVFLVFLIIVIYLGLGALLLSGRLPPQYVQLATLVVTLLPLAVVTVVFLPVEWLIAAAILAVMGADSYLVPDRYIFYPRFIPMGILALRGTVDVFIRNRPGVRWPVRFLMPFGFFTLYVMMTSVYSIKPFVTFQRAVSMAFVVIGFGVTIPIYIRTREHVYRLMRITAVVVAGSILVSLVWPLFDPRGMRSYGGGLARLAGIYINPNTTGLMAMTAIFALLALWGSVRDPILAKLQFLAVFLSTLALFMTGSRASILGTGFGLAVFMRTSRLVRGFSQRRFLIVIGIVSSLVILLLTADLAFARSGSSYRLGLWKRDWQIFSSHPILGLGFGASDDLFEADIAYLHSVGIFSGGPHNSYLRLLIDVGLLGLLWGLLSLGFALRAGVCALKTSADRVLLAGILGGVLAGMVNAVFESWLFSYGSAPTIPFWLFLSLMVYPAVASPELYEKPFYAARATSYPVGRRDLRPSR